MQVKIKVKQAGKKHPILENKCIELVGIEANTTFAEFLKAIVKQQVEEYNNKSAEQNLLPFLTKNEIENQSASGKVGFGSIYNENKADLNKAQETAVQAFEDGLFAVFINDTEVQKLDEVINFTDDTIITFIRLTFLAGSYW